VDSEASVCPSVGLLQAYRLERGLGVDMGQLGLRIALGGVVGTAVYEGDTIEFLPYLMYRQVAQN